MAAKDFVRFNDKFSGLWIGTVALRASPKPVSPGLKRRAKRVLDLLRDEFPEVHTALVHRSPFELLIATLLSAQCTDVRVNKVTPALFEAAPSPEAMVRLGQDRIQDFVKSINFFRTKAKNIFETSKILINEHQGEVPATLDALVRLPGIGQKTANVVLGNAFSTPRVVVDTHVKRLSNRLGFTEQMDALKIESDLERIFEKVDWVDSSHLLIFHGRQTCLARSPRCERCILVKLCPSRFEESDAWKK